MQYKVIGLMSGSSLDGLDIVYAHFHETAAKWSYEIQRSACYTYSREWSDRLKNSNSLSAYEYQLLHVEYGHYIGQEVNRFIQENNLSYQVQFISSHGHTSFHEPKRKMTAQLGDGAAIAAETGIHVINELRAMDLALGGQGAPIVPIGEQALLGDHHFFLNLGGIANISAHLPAPAEATEEKERFIAFDICPANRILNMLSQETGKDFDLNGAMAAAGSVNHSLLVKLNQFPYYALPYPKSLANDFGIKEVYPVIHDQEDSVQNKLRTYVEHICVQVVHAISMILQQQKQLPSPLKLLATGGGAHNEFLMARLRDVLKNLDIELMVPDQTLVDYKEALIMAFIGVLRWREENNVLSSVTGASRDSIGGALWIGK
ncbi:MAG TPA: anhydro-N-acetylmuramic acid kinase [Puia sp.]|nr:anhydro-N-acetylmuramic acid kinase [Puia sp.]